MRQTPLISVIVPVFNVEKYIDRCLSSICRQTYPNLEIVVVDDGSNDGSSLICDAWQKRDARIRVFHKQNGGLSDARNFGLNRAEGDYVTFVDSDDYVSELLVEKLLELIQNNDAQISICDLLHCTEKSIPEYRVSDSQFVYTSEQAVVEMLYQKSFLVAACGKLFSSECFENLRFPTGVLFEDSAIMYLLFERADRIAYEPSPLYSYVHREDSITTRAFDARDLYIWDICRQIDDYFSDSAEPVRASTRSYRMSAALRIILNAPKNQFDKEVDECKTWMRKNAIYVAKDRNARKKNRIAAIMFLATPALLKWVYPYVNRWEG